VWINGERTDQRKDSPPHNLTLSKGEIHIVARREFVDFALNDRRAQDFFHWLENTHIPDETFYSSLNRNPQLNIPGSYLGAYSIIMRFAVKGFKSMIIRFITYNCTHKSKYFCPKSKTAAVCFDETGHRWGYFSFLYICLPRLLRNMSPTSRPH
jgi:hypothetical protein